jgi:hypothetical protein
MKIHPSCICITSNAVGKIDAACLLVQWSKFNLAEQIEKISNWTPVPQGFHLCLSFVLPLDLRSTMSLGFNDCATPPWT